MKTTKRIINKDLAKMKKKLIRCQEMLNNVDELGVYKLRDGVFIEPGATLRRYDDEYKAEFPEYAGELYDSPYYITTDNGVTPISVQDAQELLEELERLELLD